MLTRRQMLLGLGATALSATLPNAASAAAARHITKPIPSTGERIPVIGMGTWQTFNVGSDKQLRRARTKVMRTFFEHGGGMIDSSPMYGSSQEMVGYGLEQLKSTRGLFSADKIWERDGDATREQLAETRKKWGVERFDLVQIHNLLSWEEHLEALRELKRKKVVRYIGITTSHGRRHSDLEAIMKRHPIDFVQLTYNMTHRDVEKRLLPLAKEKGIAVIANRPFDGGYLVKGLQQKKAPLPKWAARWHIENWPQFLLKWIVSHPAMTVAIPATTKVEHMRENMLAGYGTLPDAAGRKKMLKHLQSH